MRIDREMVRAYAEEFSLVEITEMRRLAMKACAEQLPRVEFTSASFDLGAAAGVFVNGKPEYLIKLFSQVKTFLENAAKVASGDGTGSGVDRRNKSMQHVDLSGRRAGW